MWIRRIIAALAAMCLWGAASAQSPGIVLDPFPEAASSFGDGERLVYTVSYRAAMWPNTDMGDVVLTVSDDVKGGVETLRIDARATVKGMFRWFYKLDDRYRSWLRKSDMRPVRAEADLTEGDYRFSSVYLYDWNKKVSDNSFRNHRHTDTTRIAIQLAGDAMDAISLFYNLRLNDIGAYTPGQSRSLALLLKDKVQFVRYTYYGREAINVPRLGRVNTLKFSCQLVNDGADSFEDGSEFFVWISDDANKVPVLLESPLRVGSIRARLVDYSGLMYETGAF